jgi:hypothetical protein
MMKQAWFKAQGLKRKAITSHWAKVEKVHALISEAARD